MLSWLNTKNNQKGHRRIDWRLFYKQSKNRVLNLLKAKLPAQTTQLDATPRNAKTTTAPTASGATHTDASAEPWAAMFATESTKKTKEETPKESAPPPKPTGGTPEKPFTAPLTPIIHTVSGATRKVTGHQDIAGRIVGWDGVTQRKLATHKTINTSNAIMYVNVNVVGNARLRAAPKKN